MTAKIATKIIQLLRKNKKPMSKKQIARKLKIDFRERYNKRTFNNLERKNRIRACNENIYDKDIKYEILIVENKYCAGCKQTLSCDQFHYSDTNTDGLRRLCKICTYQENKITGQLIRLEVLIHYSSNPPKCACCSEDKLEFLSLDHLHGGGHKHRLNDPSAIKLDTWLKRNDFPDGYQVLCMNCNCSIGLRGYCPHQIESQLINELPKDYEFRKFKRWSSKVNADDVREIRRRAQEGETAKQISKDFNLKPHSVNSIIKRK